MKVTIVKISRKTTDKDGNPLVSGPQSNKPGTPYTRLGIQTSAHGGRWLSGFGNQTNAIWAVGDEVDIEVKESNKTDTNGIPYLNFETPRPEFATKDEVNQLRLKVAELEGRLDGLPGVKAQTPPKDEVDIDSIPF